MASRGEIWGFLRQDIGHHAVGVELDGKAHHRARPEDQVDRAQQGALGDVPPVPPGKGGEHGRDADVVPHPALQQEAPGPHRQGPEDPDGEPQPPGDARHGQENVQPAGELGALQQGEEGGEGGGQGVKQGGDALVGGGPHGVGAVHGVDVQPLQEHLPVGQIHLLDDHLVPGEHLRRVKLVDEVGGADEFRAGEGQEEADGHRGQPVPAHCCRFPPAFEVFSFPHSCCCVLSFSCLFFGKMGKSSPILSFFGNLSIGMEGFLALSLACHPGGSVLS